jgi:2-polyprenyl-6-methoxyphenol hydroxylase-like FAD-dependent oxidoreductase
MAMHTDALDTDVIIVGGGPCGLVLANELGRRHVRTILLNDRPDTSPHPQANATQARTMEHYRRLGFVKRVRAAGLPSDYEPDVAFFTRLGKHELARLKQPSAASVESLVRGMSGSWSAAELPHRCSQMFIERILREEAQRLLSVSLRFGWLATGFADHGDHVAVEAVANSGTPQRLTGSYLFAADGPRSHTRKELGIHYQGERERDRPFLAGQMYSVYFQSHEFYPIIPYRPAWQYHAVNPERRAMVLALDGRSRFVLVTQLRPNEDPSALSDLDARDIVYRAVGRQFDLEIIERSPWTAGLTLVAERFQAGRVFLGGDAVHLFTPTGGLGYNTAVDDAVNIGWKLAAAVNGWAPPSILDSYGVERKPVAERNTGYARMLAESLGRFSVPPDIEEESNAGANARAQLGEYLTRHAKAEFNIPGISLGARYDGSPLIVPDGTQPPADDPNIYQPTACPGGRAPHAWLTDGRSLYDALNFEFTLLRLAGQASSPKPLLNAAGARGFPLVELDLTAENLRELYEADFALIRPDQIVCWRGDRIPSDPDRLLDQVSGLTAGAAAATSG